MPSSFAGCEEKKSRSARAVGIVAHSRAARIANGLRTAGCDEVSSLSFNYPSCI